MVMIKMNSEKFKNTFDKYKRDLLKSSSLLTSEQSIREGFRNLKDIKE